MLRRRPLTLDAATIEVLGRSIRDAVADAELGQFDERLAPYFDKAADETLRPKSIRLQLDDERVITVPLSALVPARRINLARMRIDLTARLDKRAVEALRASAPGDPPFQVTLTRRFTRDGERPPHAFDVSLEFDFSDQPQGSGGEPA